VNDLNLTHCDARLNNVQAVMQSCNFTSNTLNVWAFVLAVYQGVSFNVVG
jgi:hypothetical protein